MASWPASGPNELRYVRAEECLSTRAAEERLCLAMTVLM